MYSTMDQCWADIRVSRDMFVYESINGMQSDMGRGIVEELKGRFPVLLGNVALLILSSNDS